MSLHEWNTESLKNLEKKNDLFALVESTNTFSLNLFNHMFTSLYSHQSQFFSAPSATTHHPRSNEGPTFETKVGSKHQLRYLFAVEIWSLSSCLTLNVSV